MTIRCFLYLLLGLMFWPGVAVQAQEQISGDHVRIRWLAPQQFAKDGVALIGLYFEVDPHWHVYWRNAGDSGAAPRFKLHSEQADIGAMQWPFPARLPVAHLTNLGYEGNVAYLFELKPHTDTDKLQLTANLEWLVCKEDCIPGFGTLTLERPLADNTHWGEGVQELLQQFHARVPRLAGPTAPWQIHSAQRLSGSQARVTVITRSNAAPELYPLDGQFLAAAQPQVERTPEGFAFLVSALNGAKPPQQTGFVLAADGAAWEFPAVPVTQASPVDKVDHNLFWLLLLAVAGGVVLNLMPCVFPVLSIKLFGLTNIGGGTQRLREGLLYSLGVLVTFACLGGVFLALRAGGAAIGWGFQLQSPAVVLALILLFWLMGLSFLGTFEFGHRLMSLAGSGGGGSSAFATGMLAVFVAAPCTGPFMGVALGATATLPAIQAMAIFLGLGAGLALPFMLLAASPRLAAHLPRPGPWMEALRQLLAFPLFATVLWLLWVLNRLVGNEVWLTGALLLLLLTFALWLGRSSQRRLTVAAWALSLIAVAGAFHQVHLTQPAEAQAVTPGTWKPFEAATVSAARQRGQAVFIDFTAAWCITCQVNKKLVLDTETVNQLFDRHQALRLRADWTSQDARITAALAELGRSSVPVYAFYPADGSGPEILPQILTQAMIRELFE
jgi:thiol:disulfide interchange protein